MDVRDVMHTDVISVHRDTAFVEIATLLVERNISAVPVVDDEGAVVGIVTEGDLIVKEAYPPRRARRHAGAVIADLLLGPDPVKLKSEGLTAKDVMSSPVQLASPDEPVRAAAQRMVQHLVKRLPVVEDGKLVGIISRHDVLRLYAQSDRELEDAVQSLLTRALYVQPDHDVHVSVHDGDVRVEGSVMYESDIRVVSNLIAGCDGVVSVDNHLHYREPEPTTKTLKKDPRNIMTR